MRVACILGYYPYWGKHLPANVLDLEEGPTVGGGEENGLRVAVGLKALGHDVELWWYGQRGEWRGVPFYSLADPLYPRIVSERWDAVAAWSTVRPLEYTQPGAKRLFVNQLNDLVCVADWDRVDCIVSPSHDHAEKVKTWPIPPKEHTNNSGWRFGWWGKRAVVHNGLDAELYADALGWADRPLDVGYWSSPDRGLHHLLRAWPRVVRAVPQAKLHVFYEIDRWLELCNAQPTSFFGHRGKEVGKLLVQAKADPSVVFHGAVPRRKLAKIQKQCRVQCYPYDAFAYCEGFAGAVNQGVAAGCLVMSTPKDALPSLYGDSLHWLDKPLTDDDYSTWLSYKVIDGLLGRLPDQEKTLAAGRAAASKYTWERASREMEAACSGESWF